jgi:16S rRNA (cytosine967-C5)-methyltransferase
VQDAASKLCVACAELPAIQPKNVLDCCAAPGGKTFAAAVAMGGKGSIHACDIHAHKLELIKKGAQRLGFDNIRVYEQDATKDHAGWENAMDVVFADVPCSGYGIIRKKPDIRYKDPSTMEELPSLQLEILSKQSAYVKAGGILMYSTCTVLRRENEQVVEAFLRTHPDFYTEPLPLPEAFPKNETGMLTLIPGEFDTDGFFVCRLRRK